MWCLQVAMTFLHHKCSEWTAMLAVVTPAIDGNAIKIAWVVAEDVTTNRLGNSR